MHRRVFHRLKILPPNHASDPAHLLASGGIPRYPGQVNPYVAFISDIGAFRLRPLFRTGGIVASLTLTATIVSVHLARRERRRLSTQKGGDEQPRYEKRATILARLFDVAACPCRICITLFNNHDHPSLHRTFLFLGLAGTALSCICTAFVLWPEMWRGSAQGNELLRRSCVFSHSLNCSRDFAGEHLHRATYSGRGSLKALDSVEWFMAFVFTFYFWAFIGQLAVPNEQGRDVSEETPDPLVLVVRPGTRFYLPI